MKKLASLYAAAALVLLSSALALIHAARNRSGPPTAVVTLTDNEAACIRQKDDSGIFLRFAWSNLTNDRFAPAWLTPDQIRALGFDTSVDPDDTRAYDHYRRQRARYAYVAFEYDGPAWHRALDSIQEPDRRDTESRRGSRLIPIDAALDAAGLHSRYQSRQDILILPAVLRVSADSAWTATLTRPARPARLNVFVMQVSNEIHVPLPYSQTFRNLPSTTRPEKSDQPLYRVTLRYGRFYEPQITAVALP